ncbi:hypothetical protein Celaphus_00006472, partial [Cervus elaphus hippelaphus]
DPDCPRSFSSNQQQLVRRARLRNWTVPMKPDLYVLYCIVQKSSQGPTLSSFPTGSSMADQVIQAQNTVAAQEEDH